MTGAERRGVVVIALTAYYRIPIQGFVLEPFTFTGFCSFSLSIKVVGDTVPLVTPRQVSSTSFATHYAPIIEESSAK
jgi:hypothetical protein